MRKVTTIMMAFLVVFLALSAGRSAYAEPGETAWYTESVSH